MSLLIIDDELLSDSDKNDSCLNKAIKLVLFFVSGSASNKQLDGLTIKVYNRLFIGCYARQLLAFGFIASKVL